MGPRTIGDLVHRDAPVIPESSTIQAAVPVLLSSKLPAVPVVDDEQHFSGIFGEREFITALFPGYVGSLRHAGFVPKSIDVVLERRQSCRTEPVSRHMNTEHIEVGPHSGVDAGIHDVVQTGELQTLLVRAGVVAVVEHCGESEVGSGGLAGL